MSPLTRRAWLKSIALFGASGRRRCRDPCAENCVCFHVFGPQDPLPPPLLTAPASDAELRLPRRDFDIGLPEFMVCRAPLRFYGFHRCFWRFTRRHRDALLEKLEVALRLKTAEAAADIERLRTHLGARRPGPAGSERRAVVFVQHGDNRRLLPGVVHAAREARVDELVILKNPGEPPYLCEFPSRQCKGW